SGGAPFGVDLLLPQKYVGADEGGLDDEKTAALLPSGHRQFLDSLLENYGVPTLPDGDHVEVHPLNVSPAGIAPLLDVAFSHPIRLIPSASPAGRGARRRRT